MLLIIISLSGLAVAPTNAVAIGYNAFTGPIEFIMILFLFNLLRSLG